MAAATITALAGADFGTALSVRVTARDHLGNDVGGQDERE